jgi:hypothetical protein
MALKILGWIGIVWGGLILVGGGIQLLTGMASGGAYQVGQATSIAIGARMLYAGLRALRARPVREEPEEP